MSILHFGFRPILVTSLLLAVCLLPGGAGELPAHADGTQAKTPTAQASGKQAQNKSEEGDIVKLAQQAPDFTLSSTEGNQVTLSDLKGRLVLLNFFATWCGPCRKELPHLESEIWQTMKDRGLAVLVVGREHSVDELKEFKKKNKLTMPLLADPERKAFALYASQNIPRNYLIDKTGKVIFAETGYTPEDFERLKALIEKNL